eukprot:TRINITY_DN67791_c8_g5_i1.p1 TRINITY_DN67791_c8_g5~~TRINITY_DN67791_c8_g5_i1.p1  ORF type:complete len:629 (-),score=79.17 TRINITY_DN67791_c8_g5_i1:423-2309(-)
MEEGDSGEEFEPRPLIAPSIGSALPPPPEPTTWQIETNEPQLQHATDDNLMGPDVVTDLSQLDTYTRRRLDWFATTIQAIWRGALIRKNQTNPKLKRPRMIIVPPSAGQITPREEGLSTISPSLGSLTPKEKDREVRSPTTGTSLTASGFLNFGNSDTSDPDFSSDEEAAAALQSQLAHQQLLQEQQRQILLTQQQHEQELAREQEAHEDRMKEEWANLQQAQLNQALRQPTPLQDHEAPLDPSSSEEDELAGRRQKQLKPIRRKKQLDAAASEQRAAKRKLATRKKEEVRLKQKAKEEERFIKNRMALQDQEQSAIAQLSSDQLQEYLIQQRQIQQNGFLQQNQTLAHQIEMHNRFKKSSKQRQPRATASENGEATSEPGSPPRSTTSLRHKPPSKIDWKRPRTVAGDKGQMMVAAKKASRVSENDVKYWENRTKMLRHEMDKVVVRIENAKRLHGIHEVSAAMNEQLRTALEEQRQLQQEQLEAKKQIIKAQKDAVRSNTKEALAQHYEEKRIAREQTRQQAENNGRIIEQLRWEELERNVKQRDQIRQQRLLSVLKRVKAQAQKEEEAHKKYEACLQATIDQESVHKNEAMAMIKESTILMQNLKRLKDHHQAVMAKVDNPLLFR